MKKFRVEIIAVVLGISLVSSCTKDYDDFGPQTPGFVSPITSEKSVIVLNEGNFMFGNGSISLVDETLDDVAQEVFKQANQYPLGDVPQSMLLYDSLGYIVVNNSGKIEVVDRSNFSSVSTITGFNSPRQMAIVNTQPLTAWVTDLYANKIYEVNLEAGIITGSIASIGWNENIMVDNSSAYVLNKKDSVIHVFDINSKSVTYTYSDGGGIVDFILTDDNTVLYLANEGIYMVDLTNPGSAISVYTFDQPRSPLKMTYDIKNNYIYFLETDLYKYANGIVEKMASPKSGSNFYGLAVKPSSGEVYVTDTKDYVQPGDLIRYDQSFSDTTIYAMGINPQFILFQ